ncbi:MAG: hypothetical protein N4A68_04635 [Maledivibacter sp.]|jgi:hypothetical protein|nr:hypothetical protein [Maledivibacter sp.]
MRSIIEQLFVGEINSFDKFTRTDEYNECSSEIMKEEDEFFKKITQEQRQIFDKLADMEAGRSLIECKTHFVYGFKAGFRLAAEIYSGEND